MFKDTPQPKMIDQENLTKLNSSVFVEGYFKSTPDQNSIYPYPKTTNTKPPQDFIVKLQQIVSLIDEKMYRNHNDGLLGNMYFTQALGVSHCRVCGKQNGSCEYGILYNRKLYRFPEGIMHYYVEHGVQPSRMFREAVMNFVI